MQVKKEGILAWHRDSLGILVQRFCFVLLFFISVVMFNGCSNDPAERFQMCIWKSSVPLCISIILIVFKVSRSNLCDCLLLLGGVSEELEDPALGRLHALSNNASDRADCSGRKLSAHDRGNR